MADKTACKAKLTFVQSDGTFKATCQHEPGHEGSHHGGLKDKEGIVHMIAAWRDKNERWVRK